MDALLTSASGSPIPGGILKLQRLNGSAWQNVRLDVTGADGAATAAVPPGGGHDVRVVFVPPATQPAGR